VLNILHINTYGNKNNPPILLLHGAMALDTFANQYEVLSKEFFVIVPHLHGAGEAIEISYNPVILQQLLIELINDIHRDPMIIIGHSIGGQLAVMLVANHPHLFKKAIFLSPWVIPNEKSTNLYCKLAPVIVWAMKRSWIVRMQANYWGYTKSQANYMIDYSKRMTVENYCAFFKNTIDLEKLPTYKDVTIPMLAICGSRESKDIINSVALLGENKFCQVRVLDGAGHDFPMRKANVLNDLLVEFIRK